MLKEKYTSEPKTVKSSLEYMVSKLLTLNLMLVVAYLANTK